MRDAMGAIVATLAAMAAVGKSVGQFIGRRMHGVGVQLGAVFRGGREDMWNSLVPAFPGNPQATREPGSPGAPLPQQTMEAFKARAAESKGKSPTLEQEMRAMRGTQDQSRGR